MTKSARFFEQRALPSCLLDTTAAEAGDANAVRRAIKVISFIVTPVGMGKIPVLAQRTAHPT